MGNYFEQRGMKSFSFYPFFRGEVRDLDSRCKQGISTADESFK